MNNSRTIQDSAQVALSTMPMDADAEARLEAQAIRELERMGRALERKRSNYTPKRRGTGDSFLPRNQDAKLTIQFLTRLRSVTRSMWAGRKENQYGDAKQKAGGEDPCALQPGTGRRHLEADG